MRSEQSSSQVKTLKISHKKFSASLSPDFGASLLSFSDSEGRTFLRALDNSKQYGRDDTLLVPLSSSNFLLVPFSNRIADGKFVYNGQQISLPPNMAGCPHAIHGQGFQSKWQVESHEENRIELCFRHESGAWPWDYIARTAASLDDQGLLLELAVENCSDTAMPVGLGFHPYFDKRSLATIKASVKCAHITDDECIPLSRDSELVETLGLEKERPVPVGLDNVFDGFKHWADIAWPSLNYGCKLRASDNLDHLVIYSPEGEDFFCVEPVSHCTNAHNLISDPNWPETGLVDLEPGKSMKAFMRVEPVLDLGR